MLTAHASDGARCAGGYRGGYRQRGHRRRYRQRLSAAAIRQLSAAAIGGCCRAQLRRRVSPSAACVRLPCAPGYPAWLSGWSGWLLWLAVRGDLGCGRPDSLGRRISDGERVRIGYAGPCCRGRLCDTTRAIDNQSVWQCRLGPSPSPPLGSLRHRHSRRSRRDGETCETKLEGKAAGTGAEKFRGLIQTPSATRRTSCASVSSRDRNECLLSRGSSQFFVSLSTAHLRGRVHVWLSPVRVRIHHSGRRTPLLLQHPRSTLLPSVAQSGLVAPAAAAAECAARAQPSGL